LCFLITDGAAMRMAITHGNLSRQHALNTT
jgi:hypothetical protein